MPTFLSYKRISTAIKGLLLARLVLARQILARQSWASLSVAWLSVAFAVLMCLPCLGDTLPSVLELRNGNFVRGQLSKIQDGEILWQSEHFAQPLRFELSSATALKFAPREKKVEASGDFLIELNNRDTFFANINAIDDTHVELESEHFGKTRIRRDAIRQVNRNGENIKAYPVPSRLDEWTVSENKHWRSEGNSLVTDTKMASLYADVELPAKAMIELEFSWDTTKPSFSIYLGNNAATALGRANAFSIEVWDKFAVLQRQTKDDADLVSLAEMGVGSLHLFAYLDQTQDQMIVYDAGGKLLADLKVKSDQQTGSSLMFLNRSGLFRLDYIQVRGWSGEIPRTGDLGSARIITKDEQFSAKEFALTETALSLKDETEDEPQQVELANVLKIEFPSGPDTEKKRSETDFVAGFLDGSRLSGKLLSADDQNVTLQVPAGEEPIQLALDSLRGFAIAQSEEVESDQVMSPSGKRLGKLELMDTRLHGWFVDNQDVDNQDVVDGNEKASKDESASCLIWQPIMAKNASPLTKEAFGRVVYKEPVKKKTVVKNPAANNRAAVFRAQVMMNGRRVQPKTRKANVVSTKSARSVHLRTGDIIPCTVEKVDEQGVHINSTTTETRLLPHHQIKAAQLILNAPLPLLSKEKRARLLTLPRIQTNSPPKHLLFSEEGDVLRGSLLSLDKERLNFEVRLEPKAIPRHRVATIVWLHEDEWNAKAKEKADAVDAQTAANLGGLQVQVVRNSGSRYSFVSKSFNDETIHGESPILKTMHVNVDEIDQLLLGGFIKQSAQSLLFGRWRLNPAQAPKFVTAGDENGAGETTPGTDSPLVGIAAPDLKLKMLDEKTNFILKENRGHCVVLDFWATWCGPCLQVMPVVEEVVGEFEDKEVKLFAVNLAERPEQIKATLERRQIDVPVALDRDGVAAARYAATAIPQTVVIGPDGKIVRVFVGSSRKLADNLRAALTELTK